MGILKKIGVDWKERRLLSNFYMNQRIKEEIGRRNIRGKRNWKGVKQECLLLRTLLHTGAQITILRGKALIPPSTAVTQRSLHTCSLANYVLPPCTVNSCLCASCAIGAQASASLWSEHVTRRHTAVGDSSSGRSYVTEQWHNVLLLRTRALTHKLYLEYLMKNCFLNTGSLNI